MKQVKQTLTGFLIGIGIYAVLVEAVGFFFTDDFKSYTLGLLLGILVSVCLIFHMAATLDKALDLPAGKAEGYARCQSLVRILIMLVALLVGFKIDHFNFITLILGLLGLKIGALTAPFFLKRLYPDDFVTKEEDALAVDEDDEDEDALIQEQDNFVVEEASDIEE